MHAVFVEYFLFGIYVGGAAGTSGIITVMNKLHSASWDLHDLAMIFGWPILLPVAIVMADDYR